jgi:hypothetical protein
MTLQAYSSLVAIGPVLYALNRAGIYRSVDTGLSWWLVGPAAQSIAAFTIVEARGNLFVATNDGVLRSTDEGTTWAPFNAGITDTRVWSLVEHDGVLYAGTYGDGVFALPLSSLGVPGEPADGIDAGTVVPNPASGMATMRYTTDRPGMARLRVFDAMGREVRAQVEGSREAGTHRVAIDAAELANGVYILRLEAGGAVTTGRLVVAH